MASPSQKLRFTVESASGEDPDYPARELNFHSPHTRGWQSPRFAKFPQELTLQLEKPAQVHQIQLLSHEYKIATRIEIFVGLPPAGSLNPAQCVMKRLGYLSLDSNERSAHQARELKSVHVDTSAFVIRLVVHRCHVNKLNIYNQVGIVALNIIGEVLDVGRTMAAQAAFEGRQAAPPPARVPPPPLGGVPSRQVVPMGTDDVDSATAEQLQELMARKEAAVAAEDYDEAKRLKATIERLRSMGSEIATLEAKKQAAVDNEDYDVAKLIKAEIDRLRLANNAPVPGGDHRALSAKAVAKPKVDPNDVFNRVLTQGNKTGRVSVSSNAGGAHNARAEEEEEEPSRAGGETAEAPRGGGEEDEGTGAAYSGSHDERPIRVKNQPVYDPQEEDGAMPDPLDMRNARRTSSMRKQPPPPEEDPEGGAETAGPPTSSGCDGISADLPPPEAQGAAALKDWGGLTTVAGDYVTLCLLSKNWMLREAAIQKLDKDLQAARVGADTGPTFRALSKVLLRGASDKVANVFHASLGLLRTQITSLAAEVAPRDLQTGVSEIVPALLEKTADSNARIQLAASDAILFLAAQKEVGPAALEGALLRAVKSAAQWKAVLGRLNLLQSFVAKYGVAPPAKAGLSVEGLMGFVAEAYSSSSGEVRTAAVRLTVEVYKLIGTAVEKHLKGLKPAVRDLLSAEFEKADSALASTSGQAGAATPKPKRATADGSSRGGPKQPKQQQGGQLQQQNGGAGVSSPPGTEEDAGDEEGPTDTCQFCGVVDPVFLEGESLDLHFYHDCPMLCSCSDCGQIIEIASLTEHRLGECEEGGKYLQCTRCSEAILEAELPSHLKSKQCRVAKPPEEAGRCPMCHADIGPGEEGWTEHLLRGRGCSENPRKPKARK